MRFVPNPSFSLEDVLEGSKGKFTCTNCGKEFKEKIKRLEGNNIGVICPFCGRVHAIK